MRPSPDGARDRRDITLDLLRGYFMCVVVVDHLGWFPSLFEVVTGKDRLFASAAEGFMLISGVLVGRIRGAEVAAGRLGLATRRLWHRAATLALATAVVTLLLHTVAHLTGYAPEINGPVGTDGPLVTVVSALTLHYTYGHQYFLALYAIFLAAAPIVLWALWRGQTTAVLIVSFAVWVIGLVTPGEPSWCGRQTSELSWQVLFVIGMVVGYHTDALRARPRLSPAARTWAYRAAVALTLITLAASWLLVDDREPLLRRVFKLDEIGPGRLVCALLWVGTLYAVVKRHEAAIVRAVGRFFLPIGRHSLYVFLVHAPLVFPFLGRQQHQLLLGTLADAVALGVIWLMVDNELFFSVIPS